jgi:hypothetical protein
MFYNGTDKPSPCLRIGKGGYYSTYYRSLAIQLILFEKRGVTLNSKTHISKRKGRWKRKFPEFFKGKFKPNQWEANYFCFYPRGMTFNLLTALLKAFILAKLPAVLAHKLQQIRFQLKRAAKRPSLKFANRSI